jgi:hypothetical protein
VFRFSRSFNWLIAIAALCVAYAGPVAACVCAKGVPMEMPCCPDQHGSNHSNCDQPDSHAATVCSPVPAHALSSVSFDVFFPVAKLRCGFAALVRSWPASGADATSAVDPRLPANLSSHAAPAELAADRRPE